MANTPYSPVPLGQAGTGEAYILGSDTTALNILRQGRAAEQRAAQLAEAARQKQLAQDAKDYLDASKFNLEGGRIFQKGLTDVVAPEAQQRIMAVYQDRSLSPMQRSMKAREIQNTYEGERQMTLQKQKFADDFLKSAISDPEINQEAIALDFAAASRNPDSTPLRASQFDEEGVTNSILGKAGSYNAPVVVQNAIKGIQPAITEAVASAGKVGGIHTARTTTARFFDVDPATNQVKRTADGQAILNITDDSLALLKQNERFSILLQDRLAQTPGLDEKKAAADLIGPYATYKETASSGRNAQPRAAGKSGKGNAVTTVGGSSSGELVEGLGTEAGYSPASTRVTVYNPKKGQSEPISYSGAHFQRVTVIGADGTRRHFTNNQRALNMSFDAIQVGMIDPKTGESMFPSAEDVQRAGGNYTAAVYKMQAKPGNERFSQAGLVLIGAAKKNENFAGSPQEIFAQLQASRNEAKAGDTEQYAQMMSVFGGKKIWESDAQLWAKAQDLGSQEEATYAIPYSNSERQKALQYSQNRLTPNGETLAILDKVRRDLDAARKAAPAVRRSSVVSPEVAPKAPNRNPGTGGLYPPSFSSPAPQVKKQGNANLY